MKWRFELFWSGGGWFAAFLSVGLCIASARYAYDGNLFVAFLLVVFAASNFCFYAMVGIVKKHREELGYANRVIRCQQDLISDLRRGQQ